MKRLLVSLAILAAVCAAAGLFLTRPETVAAERFAGLSGDAEAGAQVYWAGGCASCHAEDGDDTRMILSGGYRIKSPFGTFISPNISPDPTHGVGSWTLTDFANSVLKGTSPGGSHYFPAYPYSSYAGMTDQDVADLWAFLQTLPASDIPSQPHEVGFPFNVRLAVGGWKFLFFNSDVDGASMDRGAYLVEVLGHCAECHTPRNALGALDRSRWMAGAPNPSGKGTIPALTPDKLDWSATDIAYYLETGFTPDFDSAGGGMASVVQNQSNLSPEDRMAIAEYLKGLPGG